ncbi:MAG: AtzG-like protein [Acetobacteraceae bacterium]
MGERERAYPALAAEFDVLMARAGLAIAPERRAELLVAFADLKAEVARLYAVPLPGNLEPAEVYRVAVPAVRR